MELNKKNIRALLLIIAFGAAMLAMFWNLGTVAQAVQFVFRLITFIVIGLCFAFIMNAPMRLIERGLRKPGKGFFRRFISRHARAIALVLTLLLIIGIFFLVVLLIIPELINTFALLGEQIPIFLEDTLAWLEKVSGDTGWMPEAFEMPAIDWMKVGDSALALFTSGMGSFVAGTFSAAGSVISAVVNTVVGIVLAVYMLLQKEKLIGQTKRVLYAFLPEKPVDKLTDIGRLTSDTFISFIGGQFTEVVILGLLCFLGMKLFGFPYAPMVSVLVSVTAFIPIFGAFIGAVVGAFLILVNQGAISALWFVLFFFVLQQLENNFIYPHVVGKSVMLSGLWVMVAVTLGGNIAGVLGMIVAAPVCSVVYAIMRELVNARNAQRAIDPEKLAPNDINRQ